MKSVKPYAVKPPEVMPGRIFGVVAALVIFSGRGGAMCRWRGFVLLAVYGLYVAVTLRDAGPAV